MHITNIKTAGIVFFIFSFSTVLHLWNINKIGRTWDELAQNGEGYSIIQMIKQRDFTNPFWYRMGHPPFSKLTYGSIAALDIIGKDEKGGPLFNYDLTYARLLSGLFVSFSAVIIFFLTKHYIDWFVGFMAAIIFSMLPFLLGLSQLVTVESLLILLFTASVYSFLLFLEKYSKKRMILTGVLLGLSILTKYTNVLLIPLFIWIFAIWHGRDKRKGKEFISLVSKKLVPIILIAVITSLLIYPYPIIQFHGWWQRNYGLRVTDTSHSIPEVFFGRLMFVPVPYFIIMFLITTPVILICLFFIGLLAIPGTLPYKEIFRFFMLRKLKKVHIHWTSIKRFFLLDSNKKQKSQVFLFICVAWFVLPFIQSFYNFRQHGIRYIIEIYAPFSIIAAVGIHAIAAKISNRLVWRKLLFIPVFIYMLIVLVRISPYYIDYFNCVVGGNKGVYEKRMFQMGWWGDGLHEMSLYITTHIPKGSSIGFAIIPYVLQEPLKGYKMEEYDDNKQYDYVVLSYFKEVRDQWRFKPDKIKGQYILIHEVKADSAPIVSLYKYK